MGIKKHVKAFRDRKKRSAGIGELVELTTLMALGRHAEGSTAAAMISREGICLADEELGAFIELKRRYSGYDRAIRHIAGCVKCRRKAFDLYRHTMAGRKHRHADILGRAFADARSLTAEPKRTYRARMPLLLAAAAALIIVISGLLYQVFKPEPGAAYITFFIGEVELIHNGKPAEPYIKLSLNDADVITTRENSFVLLQIEEMIVVKIAENSTVAMKSILDRKERELFTDRGKVLSRVVELPKHSMYKVGTPAIIAAVRGTEFSMSYKPGKAVLAVRRGAVSVSSGKEAKETMVPAGTTATFTDREKRQKISNPESYELETISKIPVIQGIETKNEEQIHALLKPGLGKDALHESMLKQLKAKYGHVHVVSLYNGKVIEGVILHRGAHYTILTSKGKIIVPEKQIRATRARYVK
jgi:hypothetical protein